MSVDDLEEEPNVEVNDPSTVSDPDPDPEPVMELNEPPRYPRRDRSSTPEWYVASSAQAKECVTVTTSDDPMLREALSATPEERDMWESAINEEFQYLDSKHTWTPDDNPAAQPLPTHVMLKVKRKSDGNVERFKARVVAGGNLQTYGENYKETYAPVVSFALVRIFLYLVLCKHMQVAQLDVKTAFLNGDLSENVWVMSPRGIPGRKSRCYKLLKDIYGLKQAHIAWHRKLSGEIGGIGFRELPSAPCVFRRETESEKISFILFYVMNCWFWRRTWRKETALLRSFKTCMNSDCQMRLINFWESSLDGSRTLLVTSMVSFYASLYM